MKEKIDILTLKKIAETIANELNVKPIQVAATISLIDDGATVPFIARYRKEVTGGLDDTQLRTLDERLIYLKELEERRLTILNSVAGQDKLTPELKLKIENAQTKQKLEDLYLPYKPKRRTKAQIAREAGLEPLADDLFNNRQLTPETEAEKYINLEQEPPEKHIADVKAALTGAKHILVEHFSEDAELLEKLRGLLLKQGLLVSKVVEGKENEGEKFRDWFDFQESVNTIPSHRALALFRGRNQDVLQLRLKTPTELLETPMPSPCENIIASNFNITNNNQPTSKWLLEVVRWTWAVKLSLQLEVEIMGQLRERAEEEAIRVFAKNLHDLLLSPPAGLQVTLGLDPGIRTGVKVAVTDQTGKVVDTTTIYPHAPRNDWNGSLISLAKLIKKHKIELIAIGNGTASRETAKLASQIIKLVYEDDGSKIIKVIVNEAGASVYSASALAAQEFPNLDVSLRGAVSIARRLQDPLAELVKIEPKSIGVGQYQHDINQIRLAKSLDGVVEDCVNAVGVDINTASTALLSHISGLNKTLAENIVKYRDENGRFNSRAQIRKIPRLGDKTYEQAAGFLRVNDGKNPLDSSAVHPESYPLVEKILADIGKKASDVIGDSLVIKSIQAEKYINDKFGLPTIRDILRELEKPGRDPRPEFTTANFKDGVEEIKDLIPGMIIEGVVTNVTNFGAFVDVGVHQDGLVHISALSNSYVQDPHKVVRAGEVVKVKILEVDINRKRIALSMRMGDTPTNSKQSNSKDNRGANNNNKNSFVNKGGSNSKQPATGTLAEAFAKAGKR